MGKKNILSDEDISNLKKLIEEGIFQDAEIARTIKTSTRTIRVYRRKWGIPLTGHSMRGPVKLDNGKFLCRGCYKEREEDDFIWKDKSTKVEKVKRCKFCIYKKTNERMSEIDSFIKHRVASLRCTSKKNGIPFSLSFEYAKKLFEFQRGICFYTDIPLCWTRGKEYKDASDRCSLDKIEPSKGYVEGNIVWCSRRSNLVKQDLTLDEMKNWTPDWYNRIHNFQTNYSSFLEQS